MIKCPACGSTDHEQWPDNHVCCEECGCGVVKCSPTCKGCAEVTRHYICEASIKHGTEVNNIRLYRFAVERFILGFYMWQFADRKLVPCEVELGGDHSECFKCPACENKSGVIECGICQTH